MIIYKITNTINNKIYIGQTIKSLKSRIQAHKNSINSKGVRPLYSAMKKYGWENFKFEIIQQCFCKEELNNAEKYYIKLYNTLSPNGYNLADGGQTNIMSSDGRVKVGNASKLRWQNPIYREKMINKLTGIKRSGIPWNKGKKSSPEVVAKIKISRKNKYCGPANHNYGKPGFMSGKIFSDDHKNKIAKALIGNTNGKHKAKAIKCVETNEIFTNINELRKKYPKGNIYKAIRNKTLSCGYHWEFVSNTIRFRAQTLSV